jgi:dTDP-4-dehydrorhamnose reductase
MAALHKIMKILLLGKNGQLGSELDRQAKAQDYEVVSFGREDLDISDAAKVTEIITGEKPDFVINASAFHVVPECEQFPQKAFDINTSAIKHLSELSNDLGFTFVHFSTDYIFDGLLGKPYSEDAKPNPLQTYGISKVAGEYYVLNYAEKGIVIRTCGVYNGRSGSRAKKGNFILTIFKQAEGKEELEVSSEQIVSPTYAVDLASATLKLIVNKKSRGVYHLINEGYCSWAEFAQQALIYNKSKTKIIPVDRSGMAGSLRRPLFSALQNSRAKELNIVLPSWQNALKRYIKTL